MAHVVGPKTVLVYQDENGHEPFTRWVHGLRDGRARRLVFNRVRRLEQGNLWRLRTGW